MPLDFPASPVNGQIYNLGSRYWKWNSTTSTWDATSGTSLLIFTGFDGGTATSSAFDLTLDLGAAS